MNSDFIIYNPNSVPEDELPAIYVYKVEDVPEANGIIGRAIAEDGTQLAEHISSNKFWLQRDLGVMHAGGLRASYKGHYPGGFRMVFVEECEKDHHIGLQTALRKLATKDLKFKCPTCDGTIINEVLTDCYVYIPIIGIYDGEVDYDHSNMELSDGDGDVLYYECKDCGLLLVDEHKNIIHTPDDLIEYLRINHV